MERFPSGTRGFKRNLSTSLFAFLVLFGLVETGLQIAAWRVRRVVASRVSPNARPGAFRILCLGESTTAPTTGRSDHSWPRQLEGILNEKAGEARFEVVNAGVGSTSSAIILARLRGYLDEYKPQMVIAMMGANDNRWFGTLQIAEDRGVQSILYRIRTYRLLRFAWDEAAYRLEKMTSPVSDANIDSPAAADAVPEPPRGPKSNECASFPDELKEADYARVERICKAAVAESPRDSAAYVRLGNLYYTNEHRFDEAARAYEKALELGSRRFDANVNLGNIYYHQAKWDRAQAAYERLVATEEPGLLPYLALANLYWMKGWNARAQDMYRKAIARAGGPLDERDFLGVSVRPPAGATAKGSIEDGAIVTATHYRQMRTMLRARGILLVSMQYPTKDVGELVKMFDDPSGVIFISNKENFRDALRKGSYSDYFWDRYGRTWGHCTQKGDRIIAEGLAEKLAGVLGLGDRRPGEGLVAGSANRPILGDDGKPAGP